MKMKKIAIMAALAAFTFGLNAQSLMVESAFQDMNKGSLKKAKTEIDAAAVHEKTKDDPKTWFYRAFIYAKIGDDAAKPKPKYKDLAPDWADQAYESAMECKRLDSENEYSAKLKSVFGAVGIEYYNRARNLFDQKNYTESMQVAAKAVEMFNNGEEGKNAGEAMFVAGMSAMASHDTANVKKYFNPLVRKRTDKEQVYSILFNIYKAEKNGKQAMNVASSYMKANPKDYRAYLLMAEGYLMDQNVEKGKEMINSALELTKEDINVYPTLLAQSAALLELTEDYAGAEAKYMESLQLKPDQFEANFNMGKMFYNRAVDKVNGAPEPDPFDENSLALYDKLVEESKDLFRQSITYLVKAVEFLDNMPEDQKPYHRTELANSLTALGTAYARVEMYAESKAAHERVQKMSAE